MKDKIMNFGNGALERFRHMSKKVLIAVVVILLIAAAVVVFLLNNKPYEVLVTGVSSSEASSILTYLDSQGVTDYKVENNDTILVPKSQVSTLKAKIVMQGYPQTGYAYSAYYDHVSALSTESERKNAYMMFLMESMSNVIRTFENVQDATVIISPGEDRGYVLDSGNVVDATASVQVKMAGAAKLSSEQVAAIRNLVAHGVQGLDLENVAISDTMGNKYSSDDSNTTGDASELKIRLEEDYENKIRTEVMQSLTPFFGSENVRVSVNCAVELSQRTVNSRDVHLPEYAQDGSTNGGGIIGSRIYEYYVDREEEDTVGGLVGSETNSDIPEYVEDIADPNGTETALGGSGQVDYDNSYTETEALYTAGYLSDCTVAVSINRAVAGTANLDDIRQHVARASGIVGTVDTLTGLEYLGDKISVIVMDFQVEEEPTITETSGIPIWALAAAIGGMLLFIILLVVLLLRKKKHSKEDPERTYDEVMAAGMAGGADVMNMQTEKSMELRKDVRQFASDNPEIVAQMVRGWLKEAE